LLRVSLGAIGPWQLAILFQPGEKVNFFPFRPSYCSALVHDVRITHRG
jgi:hypothetical protein